MSLMRPFSSVRDDLNQIFNEMERGLFSPMRPGRGQHGEFGNTDLITALIPPVDVVDEGDKIRVKALLPDVKPEELEIEIDMNSLILHGETTHQEEEKQGNVYRREIVQGSVYRRIPLPSEVQPEQAKAEFENGALTIILPKSQEAKRHKIKAKRK